MMKPKLKQALSTSDMRAVGFLIFILLLLCSQLVACSQDINIGVPVEITVQLNGPHSAEYAGFYVAQQYGYYTEENLVVNLTAGGAGINPIEKVMSGTAQIGISTDVDILQARSTGSEVTAIASIFQTSPLVAISLPGSDIVRPDDLVGKKVGVISANMDTSRDILFMAMLKNMDIDPASMEFVPIKDNTGANELTSDKAQVASGFLSTREATQSRIGGIPVNQIFYTEYGITSYINPIFTLESLMRQQPELIQSFVRATLRGYHEALKDPRAAAQLCLLYDNQLNVFLETSVLTAQIPFIDPIYHPLGWMDRTVWENVHSILLDFGIIESPVDLDRVFSIRFVEEVQ